MHTKLIAGLVLILGVATLWMILGGTDEAERTVDAIEEATDTTYAWRFADAETKNPDGGQQTRVIFVVTTGGVREERLIDTVDGECSELSGEEYAVQCYYAGFGQRYRLVEREGSYTVDRLYFEEALPDVDAPEHSWETVAVITR